VAGSMRGFQILKVVGHGDSLGLDGAKEVLHYRVRVIPEGDYDCISMCLDEVVVTEKEEEEKIEKKFGKK
jgi:hypothetical protein